MYVDCLFYAGASFCFETMNKKSNIIVGVNGKDMFIRLSCMCMTMSQYKGKYQYNIIYMT